MTKYLLISSYIRKLFLIYDFATSEFPYTVYEENLIFFFISAGVQFMLTKLQRTKGTILKQNAKIYIFRHGENTAVERRTYKRGQTGASFPQT
jgi:hypothetical protein